MATTMTRATVGVFARREDATQAVEGLRDAGYRDDQISVVWSDPRARTVDETAADGARTGAAVGATTATLASLGVSFGVLPVFGPVLATGPLAAALFSAVGGVAAGSLAGALVALGLSEEDGGFYEGEVGSGRYFVSVDPAGRDEADARAILTRHGGYERSRALVS